MSGPGGRFHDRVHQSPGSRTLMCTIMKRIRPGVRFVPIYPPRDAGGPIVQPRLSAMAASLARTNYVAELMSTWSRQEWRGS